MTSSALRSSVGSSCPPGQQGRRGWDAGTHLVPTHRCCETRLQDLWPSQVPGRFGEGPTGRASAEPADSQAEARGWQDWADCRPYGPKDPGSPPCALRLPDPNRKAHAEQMRNERRCILKRSFCFPSHGFLVSLPQLTPLSVPPRRLSRLGVAENNHGGRISQSNGSQRQPGRKGSAVPPSTGTGTSVTMGSRAASHPCPREGPQAGSDGASPLPKSLHLTSTSRSRNKTSPTPAISSSIHEG